MTPTVTVYVSRLFLGRLVVVGFGFVALLQVFDLLKNARDILERHGDGLASLAYYAALRLPGTISFLLPLCVLVAALMTLARLAQHNEMIALKAAGLSLYRLLLGFVPAALAIALAQWLLADQLATAANRALERWDAESVAEAPGSVAERRAVWVRSGPWVARIGAVLADGHELVDVTLFRRDPSGNLSERLVARKARYAGGGWRLGDVRRTVWPRLGPPETSRIARYLWLSALAPGEIADLSTDPKGLSLQALLGFARASGLGTHPRHFYRTWVQKRLATPASALVMIVLAVSVTQTLARGSAMAVNVAAGIGLGFLYLIAEGVVLTLGEAGTLPPVLAAWAPVAVFGSIGGAALVVREGG